MTKIHKSKSILRQIEYLETLKPTYERNILIGKLRYEMEEIGDKNLKFNYIKHHMNIDIYEIIGKDLYGHMSRLIDTMNENNVVDFENLAVGRAMRFNIKRDLIAYGIIKKAKLGKNLNHKLYMNPLFGLKNRVYPGNELIQEFAEINKRVYNIKL